MAFMDWQVPDTSLKVRMGLQNLTLPTKAGNSSVAGNLDVAGIVASWQFSETVGLSALWLRPFNDNYSAEGNTNYLDNMDIWGLTLPVRLEGFEMTPWVLYGIRGKNTFNGTQIWNDGNPMTSMGAYPFGMTAAAAHSGRAGWPRPLWNTRRTGAGPASSAGTAAVTTATSRTVPSVCPACAPTACSRPSWAMTSITAAACRTRR